MKRRLVLILIALLVSTGVAEAAHFTLTVTVSGSGTGTVTSSPPGIICGSSCTLAVNSRTVFTLTATPASGSTFPGWSGSGCSGTSSCVVVVNGNTSVSATFNTSSPPPPPPSGQLYSTNFSIPEDPISEGGRWISGKSVGLIWNDVNTLPGFATFSGTSPSGYADAVAVLTGSWAANQYVRVVVKNPQSDPNFPQEKAIFLRGTIAPNSIMGYEALECSQIVRWNGAQGDFIVLNAQYPQGAALPVNDGDVLSAQIVDNTIRVFVNGIECMNVVDTAIASGNPGISFFTREALTYYRHHPQFGFSSFTASESPIQ